MNKLRHRRLAAIAAILSLCFVTGAAHAATIKFVTEYRYPTDYEVTPIVGIGPGGIATIVGGIVTPSGFEMREVGVVMSVDAAVAEFGGLVQTMQKEGVHGTTDLMVAATSGDLSRTRALLARRTNVNAVNKYGSTALMGAAAGGHDEIVKLLVHSRARVNTRSKTGASALSFAAKNGHLSVVEMLLRKGAQVNASDNTGRSALMYAVDAGHVGVVQALGAKGASVNVRDRAGQTPLMVASARRDRDLIILLTRFGARR